MATRKHFFKHGSKVLTFVNILYDMYKIVMETLSFCIYMTVDVTYVIKKPTQG